MFVVSREGQTNNRIKRILVWRIRPDGSAIIAGEFDKRNGVYTPRRRITTQSTMAAQYVRRWLEDDLVMTPRPPLLGLLPALEGPDGDEAAPAVGPEEEEE